MRIEEQIRAAKPGRSVLLSASAGSGKTHVLVRRIMHLIAAGAKPGEIAAITFTEKAAAQMKERLYKELGKAAWEETGVLELLGLEPKDPPFPLLKNPEEIFSELASRPDALGISTIHAFCLGLLRRSPLEAGVPPEFSILDDAEIPVRRIAAVDACVERAEEEGLADDFRILADAGLSILKIKVLLLTALDKRGHIARVEAELGGFDRFVEMIEEKGRSEGRRASEILSQGMASDAAGIMNLLRGYPGITLSGADVESVLSGLERLRSLKSAEGFPPALEDLFEYFYTKEFSFKAKSPLTKTAAKKASRENADALVDSHDAIYFKLRQDVDKLARACDGITAAKAFASFIRLYRACGSAYTSSNHAEGMLDYDDLEIYAYRLLTGSNAAGALSRAEESILHYLVDEFQDTGDLQWGIVERLNEEVFAGEGVEGMRAPTLFAVGDKKQSIYRFRKANYRLMDVLKKKMEESIAESRRDFPELDYNFRSAPEVITVVDEVFKVLMDDFHPSRPYRRDAKGSVRLRLTPEGLEAQVLAEEVEAAAGAAIFEEGEARPARYGDMAVLIRTRTGLKAYEKALREKGIPFKVVGGTGFFYQDEIQTLINILRYLDNASDLLPLAAVLKSPLYSLTDIEIEPLFMERDASAMLGGIGKDTAGQFAAWRVMAGFEAVGSLLESVVRDSGAIPAFGLAGGPAAVLNIEKLLGMARDFDMRGGAGLSGFIEWVKAYRDNTEAATADIELPVNSDYVSIMTVHTAKGLEFPVVFLPGAARGTRNTVEDFLIEDDGHGGHVLGIRTSGLLGENESYSFLKDVEKQELLEESKRLLYVAMTRAMDHLIIIGEDRKPASDTWLQFLNQAAPASLYGVNGAPLLEGSYEYPEGSRAHIESKEGQAEQAEAAMPPEGRLKPLTPPVSLTFASPSAMAMPLEDTRKEAAGADPLLRGTIIHRALEAYGRSGVYDLAAIAKAEPGFALLGAKEAEELLGDMASAIYKLLGDDGIKRLFTGEGRHFELPLLMRRDNEIISGAADLVIVEGDRAMVVDYKTGLEGFSEKEIAKAYSPQLAAYADAVREALGVISVDCFILLVDRVMLIRVPV